MRIPLFFIGIVKEFGFVLDFPGAMCPVVGAPRIVHAAQFT
jgi:hypothetical protein